MCKDMTFNHGTPKQRALRIPTMCWYRLRIVLRPCLAQTRWLKAQTAKLKEEYRSLIIKMPCLAVLLTVVNYLHRWRFNCRTNKKDADSNIHTKNADLWFFIVGGKALECVLKTYCLQTAIVREWLAVSSEERCKQQDNRNSLSGLFWPGASWKGANSNAVAE